MITLRLPLAFVLLLTACAHVYAEAFYKPPSEKTIQAWWKKHSEEGMSIDGDLLEIHLRNKEIAYLVPVEFDSRGRNETWHAIMIRPKIKEAREVRDPVRRDMVAYDLDQDGVSEVTAVASGSGGGTTEGVNAIVQFKGWYPVVLHQAEFHNNLGACGEPAKGGIGRCKSVHSKWTFKDIDGDGIDDLVEETEIDQGMDPDELKTTTRTHQYLFKNNKFIPAKNTQKSQ